MSKNAHIAKSCQIDSYLESMHGKELTSKERDRIEWYLKGNWKIRQIGRTLKRNHGVISREIDRNKKPDGTYSAVYAQELCEKRRVRRGNVKRKLDENDVLRNWVIRQLKDGWSPEKISGRLKNHPNSEVAGSYVCHETIYSYIYKGDGRFMGLYQYLIRKHKKRRMVFSRKPHKERGILYITPIKFRPKLIKKRMEVGHWESDSIVSRESKPALNVLRELLTHRILITHLSNMKAESTEEAIRGRIETEGSQHIKSITFDRGSEGATHYKLRTDYNIDTYHCDPYCSWQKGAVENSNGLIRRFFPKGTDFNLITYQDIYAIQEKLNNQPRKSLNYRTPPVE